MREEVLAAIERERLIAIVRGVESSKCMKVAQALYDGGVRLLEITYDQKHPETWEETAKAVGDTARAFAGKMHVGSGTVTSVELVELTHKNGGAFCLAPDTNEAVIRRTVELGMVSIPGALTPTEVMVAHRAGADLVKLFPAGDLGAGYMKALRAPISHVKLLAVGGVNEKNIPAFLAAGAVGVGVGGNLANRAWIEAGEYEKLTEAARAMTAVIRDAQ